MDNWQTWIAYTAVFVTVLIFALRTWQRANRKNKSTCAKDCGCEANKVQRDPTIERIIREREKE